MNTNIQTPLYNSLLGGAVGDAYGLPFEGLRPKRINSRIAKRFNSGNAYRLIPIIKGGMVSDDTEHAVMTVQAFIASGGDVHKFKTALQWRLVAWLATLPCGVGMATGRSIFKMAFGLMLSPIFKVKDTGVFSAGNGGAMRSSVLGVLCADLEDLKQFVKTSTTLTHTDPKAYQGSLCVALLAWVQTYHFDWTTDEILAFLKTHLDDELFELIDRYTPDAKGVTGYMYHTVPMVVQAFLKFRDKPVAGLNFLIQQGGDTDSTCAIFGGVVGVRYGQAMFEQIAGVWCEPKVRPSWLNQLSHQAEQVYQTNQAQTPMRLFGIWTYPRNLVFLLIVLLHGFGRLLPPY